MRDHGKKRENRYIRKRKRLLLLRHPSVTCSTRNIFSCNSTSVVWNSNIGMDNMCLLVYYISYVQPENYHGGAAFRALVSWSFSRNLALQGTNSLNPCLPFPLQGGGRWGNISVTRNESLIIHGMVPWRCSCLINRKTFGFFERRVNRHQSKVCPP